MMVVDRLWGYDIITEGLRIFVVLEAVSKGALSVFALQ